MRGKLKRNYCCLLEVRELCNPRSFISKEPGKSSKKYLNLLNFPEKQERTETSHDSQRRLSRKL
jgi:hypothetical protein